LRHQSAPEEKAMAFKPNYNHQRAERNRAKEQKKLEKRQRRDEEAARRKGTLDESGDAGTAVAGDAIHGETSPANSSEDPGGPQETEN
jgi:hypothetical protein